MRYVFFLAASLLFSSCAQDSAPTPIHPAVGTLYFPPVGSPNWATTPPESLGWNTANLPALYEFLETNQTRAFLVLKDGRIVLEKYFGQNQAGTGPFTQNSPW